MDQLLAELSEKLGFCRAGLDPERFESLAARGPDEFTDEVLRVEGLDPASNKQQRRIVHAEVARHLSGMNLARAIARFRKAANETREVHPSPSTASELYEEMAHAWRALDECGEIGREAFRSLLADESIHVQRWVAAQLLALGDESGLGLLEADAAGTGVGAFNSRMVLQEWRAGRLRPPF